eukprot:Nitzschia sp. Nitz4//scaffold103_size77763//44363//45394//NITZ4_005446-RA/size77763-processed-gene-0.9-mRNA-1//1//CDS//3329532331//6087//frame0
MIHTKNPAVEQSSSWTSFDASPFFQKAKPGIPITKEDPLGEVLRVDTSSTVSASESSSAERHEEELSTSEEKQTYSASVLEELPVVDADDNPLGQNLGENEQHVTPSSDDIAAPQLTTTTDQPNLEEEEGDCEDKFDPSKLSLSQELMTTAATLSETMISNGLPVQAALNTQDRTLMDEIQHFASSTSNVASGVWDSLQVLFYQKLSPDDVESIRERVSKRPTVEFTEDSNMPPTLDACLADSLTFVSTGDGDDTFCDYDDDDDGGLRSKTDDMSSLTGPAGGPIPLSALGKGADNQRVPFEVVGIDSSIEYAEEEEDSWAYDMSERKITRATSSSSLGSQSC